MITPLAAAEQYIDRGLLPVPIPLREKAPKIYGWPTLRLTCADLPKHFNGEPSIRVDIWVKNVARRPLNRRKQLVSRVDPKIPRWSSAKSKRTSHVYRGAPVRFFRFEAPA
jgi:hypothetical protein